MSLSENLRFCIASFKNVESEGSFTAPEMSSSNTIREAKTTIKNIVPVRKI